MLEDTPLYKLLEQKCNAGETGTIKASKLLNGVRDAAEEFGKILNRTCINFEDYTLHDEAHAVRVVHGMFRLMGAKQAAKLNVIEISLLILSAFGHDVGMAIGREQREELRRSDEYKEYLLKHERLWEEAQEAGAHGEEARQKHLDSQLFQNYLRSQHHLLSAKLMQGEYAKHLKFDKRSLAKGTALLCKSHGESIAEVAKLKDLPFASDFLCNLQYLACVLRLADYLDLDAVRAPSSVFALIDHENERSIREWRVHQATNFYLDERTIKFQADFDDFYREKALRDTLAGIEKERRECMDLLTQARFGAKYKLRLDSPVEINIESNGYRFEDFSFRLEYKQIMALLMGTRLYRDERVFLRELLQNSLDACRHADAVAKQLGRADYKGKITVARYKTDDGEVLEVHDNGAGMTRSIISEYFMRVGRSFYQSFAFRRRDLRFQPVSQFGIGILSCFMKADYFEVETCPDRNVHRDDPDAELALKLEIRGPHEYFIVRELKRTEPGTTLRLYLKNPLTESLQSLVKRFVGRIPYLIEVKERDEAPITIEGEPFDFSDDRFSMSFFEMPDAFGYCKRDLEFEGEFGFDLKGVMRFYLLESNNRRYLQLRDAGQYAWVGFGRTGETVINVKRLTQTVKDEFDRVILQLRGISREFPDGPRTDLSRIMDDFDRIGDQLMRRHQSDEIQTRWEALKAQIQALYHAPEFQSRPSAIQVQKQLTRAQDEIESFVSGEIIRSHPNGILTQDGINLTGTARLPELLRVGIGYVYNLDLCGEHRLSLTAARDEVIQDKRMDDLVGMFHERIGRFLGTWFREEQLNEDDVSTYVRKAPKRLGDAVARSYAE